jgi:YD repeat-containing protein
MSDTDGHQTIYDFSPSSGIVSGTVDYVNNSVSLSKTYSYDSANYNLTSETDARGNETDYEYDAYGDEVAQALPSPSSGASRPTSYYSYNSVFDITSFCDPVSVNNAGRNWGSSPPTVSDAMCPSGTSGAVVMGWQSTAAEPYDELTSITTPLGYTRSIAYATSPQGGTDYGLPTSVTGTPITQKDGTSRTPTEQYTYDAYGNVLCYGNGSGTYALQYDSLNRRTAVADPDDGSISQCGKPSTSYKTASYTSYFPDSTISETQTPAQYATAGTGTTFTYDGDADKTTETNYFTAGIPIQKAFYYDGDDRLVEMNNAVGQSAGWLTRYYYDISQNHGVSLTATGTFQAHGNLYGVAVVQGNEQKGIAYDALDRETTNYRWPMNCYGSCTSVNSATKAYDASQSTLGLLSSTTNEVGSIASYAYDADGREQSVSYSDGVTPNQSMSYDPDGRPIAITSSTFGTMTEAYDADGRLAKRVEGTGTGFVSPATLTYDYYGDGTRADLNVASSALTEAPLFQYSYRPDGMRQTLAANGSSISATYQWSQTPGGRYTSQILASGGISQTTTQSYDVTGRALAKSVPTSEPYSSVSIAAYDLQDELTSATFGTSSPVTETNTYDVLHQLTSTTPSAKTGSYCPGGACPYTRQSYLLGAIALTATDTYAAANNSETRVAQTSDARTGAALSQTTTTTAVPGATPIPSPSCGGPPSNGRSFSYDKSGRETSGSWSWSKSQESVVAPHGAPTCTSSTGNGSFSQTFDANNRLISRTETRWDSEVSGGNFPPLSWSFSWAQDGHVAVASNAYTGGNSDTASLHWDGDNLLFETDTDGFTEIYIDGALGGFIGNQLSTCGSQFVGNPSSSCGDFDFAGYTRSSEGYALNLVQFPSRFSGPDTKTSFPELFTYAGPGMISDGVNTFQGVRQMDNMTNQWVTPDAYAGRVEDPMSQRPYAWNGNNPVQYSDPSGYQAVAIPVAGGFALEGLGTLLIDAGITIGGVSVGAALVNTGHSITDPIFGNGAHLSAPEPEAGQAPEEARDPSKDVKMSPSAVKDLEKQSGESAHEMKEGIGGSKGDLFRDPKTGKVYIKPKDGSGPGEDTGHVYKPR